MRSPAARAVAAALAALAWAAAGCVSDPYREIVPGQEARVVLLPGPAPATARWPVPFRRAAEFVVENRTGEPVETLIFDFSGKGRPRELVEAVITDPPGRNAYILPAPHPDWSLRARLGDAGTVLLEPGERLTLRVLVSGTSGAAVAKVSIPGRE